MPTEFDQYSANYADLLRDPIRDRFTATPDFFHKRKLSILVEFLSQRKMNPSRMSWLDVGCGQGDLLKIGSSVFARAQGCDPSHEMIKSGSSLQIVEQPSPTELPFPNESFDLATAVCVYHHVPRERQAALTASIYKVLKPGGIACVIEHNPWNPATQLIVKKCPVDWDAQLLTKSQAAGLLRSVGFRVVDAIYFLYFPERLFRRAGRLENLLGKVPFGGQFALFGIKAASLMPSRVKD
ncbi:MAG TPA: class I SAM-dependent methyltransferase [Bryobacteraceae bacterium]|jgi:SAM-dependent methyltransferase